MLAVEHREEKTVMIDAPPPCTPDGDHHCFPKGGHGRLIGHTKGGMYNKLHALCDSDGRPLDLFFTGGEVSDFVGARELRGSLSNVGWLLQDRSYDADWFGEA